MANAVLAQLLYFVCEMYLVDVIKSFFLKRRHFAL